MSRIGLYIVSLQLLVSPFTRASAASDAPGSSERPRWINLPAPEIQVLGLPWYETNAPELWRLPRDARNQVPPAVWQRALAPCGGRLIFRCDSSSVFLKAEPPQNSRRTGFFDVYVDGSYLASAAITNSKSNSTEFRLFDGKSRKQKNVTIYLPHNSPVRVLGIGVNANTRFEKPAMFSTKAPIVCYGSSVLQGTGAAHPSKTYPAILARELNLDFVNLGFGGAGKAEPQVVSLVSALNASAFVFDLGKSYGDQSAEPYKQMLKAIRAAHPKTPVFCVTPIYSTKEESDPAYRDKSERLRVLMRNAAVERREAGDTTVHVVEGLDLFGKADAPLFHDPLHPNDDGNQRIAKRLGSVMRHTLFE